MITKDMVNSVKEHRASLLAQIRQIDAFLGLFGIGVAAPAGASKKGKRKETATDASARARKAWATKKRKAEEAAAASPVNGASLLEAV